MPVVPRTFPPAPGCSTDGHRIKAQLVYSCGEGKIWVYGVLLVRDAQELIRCALSRNSQSDITLRASIEGVNPTGDSFVKISNLSSHDSAEIRALLTEHLRIQRLFIAKVACWLDLQER